MRTGKALTFVEIDIPAFSPPSPETVVTTVRFAVDTFYLRESGIEAIPSIRSVSVSPGTVSLGEDLGQRATVTVSFDDHRHIFASEDFASGTFWGKFRARYGLRLRGRSLRLIQGLLGDALADMETRHFVIESQDGPSSDGIYKIVAKDLFVLANDDRTQAPVLSNGFLNAAITNSDLSATLAPSGIGNLEYPAAGHVNIGGNEICAFTRAGDVLTISRAQHNTVASAHDANDRVQVCLIYSGMSPDQIIFDLFSNYTNILDYYTIDQSAWAVEYAAYLGTVYTAVIAEPTGVAKLISELVEQAALAVWPDEIEQIIRFQVLRAIPTTADTYDGDNTLADSLEVEEQPSKRISEVVVYFGKINPTVSEDQDNNYRSTQRVTDDDAAAAYGGAVIKKIRSRWIAAGGSIVATTLGNKILGRYRDPPRRLRFDVMRYTDQDPLLGQGYKLGGIPFQETDGTPALVPVQVTQVNPMADRFVVEAEEMLWTPFGGDIDPATRTIVFDFNVNDVNLQTYHDSLYNTAESGDTIECYITSGTIIGSSSTSSPAFTVGTFVGGVTVNIYIYGRIQGHGGLGGNGASFQNGFPGNVGGPAFFTAQACTVNNFGEVWGGGGGGGGSARQIGSGGGGGGAGQLPGGGGSATDLSGNPAPGNPGTTELGGVGGNSGGGGVVGGTGGGPGLPGSAGSNAGVFPGGAGGSAGLAVSGKSFINGGAGLTTGDVRGNQTG